MITLHSALRRWTWVALLAICGLAIAPTVSAALATAGDGAWVEVCSAQGSRVVKSGDLDSPAPGPVGASPGHCLLCGLSAPPLPGPAQGVALAWAPLPADAAPWPPLLCTGWSMPAWAPSQPRAPPVLA